MVRLAIIEFEDRKERGKGGTSGEADEDIEGDASGGSSAARRPWKSNFEKVT